MGLSLIQLVMRVEERLALSMPDDEAEGITMPETVEYLAGMAFRYQSGQGYAQVLQVVREIAAEVAGVPVSRVLPGSHLVRDLGLG